MPIGVAIVGSGIFAKEQHLPAILATPALSLIAVYSRSLASASSLSENLDQKIEWYSDETADQGRGYEDLLKNDDIKAIVVALPILSQPEYIKKALKAGKHVLSEKPIAGDVETAKKLVEWYRSGGEVDSKKVTWGVAENFRYQGAYHQASKEAADLGRVLGFHLRMSAFVNPGSKYYETSWRKTPEYQGGFLLDGGIHFVAGIRNMLGPNDDIARVSAYTTQLQKHLPPIDSMNATCKTKTGVSGTINVSFGTTFKGSMYAVAFEKGTVTVNGGDVIIDRNGSEEKKSFPTEGAGVPEEIRGWAEGLEAGALEARQSPEEALKDLQVLEAIFKSGEKDGEPLDTGV